MTIARLRAAMRLEGFDAAAAWRPIAPPGRGRAPAGPPAPRPAAALAYVFERAGRLALPLTLRRAELPEHGGQVSLPGGRPRPGESPWETALREAREEVGLDGAAAERLGALAPVYVPVSATLLAVEVALGPDPGASRPCPREVERVLLLGLDDLLDPARRRRGLVERAGREVVFYDLGGVALWGATAMALSELASRLEAVPA